MSVPAGVDGDAPVRAHHETDISAPLDTVWQLHADVNAWPAWQPTSPGRSVKTPGLAGRDATVKMLARPI